jgi:Rieske Fe-S protein
MTDRRTLLKGAAVAGVALPFLAACGGGGSDTPSTGETAGSDTPSTGEGARTVIAKTGDVPKGGGIILTDVGIVITQPDAGDFKGFTDICTHAGCPVSNVQDGTINCLCHGSQYSITDGSVVAGPAPSPLASKPITIKGANILLG